MVNTHFAKQHISLRGISPSKTRQCDWAVSSHTFIYADSHGVCCQDRVTPAPSPMPSAGTVRAEAGCGPDGTTASSAAGDEQERGRSATHRAVSSSFLAPVRKEDFPSMKIRISPRLHGWANQWAHWVSQKYILLKNPNPKTGLISYFAITKMHVGVTLKKVNRGVRKMKVWWGHTFFKA